jgi:hypothetical protein
MRRFLLLMTETPGGEARIHQMNMIYIGGTYMVGPALDISAGAD